MPSFQQPTISSRICSNFDEEQWVMNIRQALDENLVELDNENPVHIFTVPPTLMVIDPFSFIPQQVSIGPYHFSRPELSEMEAYKVAAERRNQSKLHNLKLQNLVDQIILYEPHIRASYHKFLNFSCETLAWMMAVDASFLLEFLQICAISAGGKERIDISSRKLSHLVNLSHNTTNNAILRDIIMLENQIPLCVLRKLLEFHFSSVEKADEMLHLMLVGLCEELSPFKMEESWPKIKVKKFSHLLDVLYRYAVPKLEGFSDITEVEENVFLMAEEGSENCGENPEDKDFIYRVWRRMSGSKGAEEFTEEIANPLRKIVKFPSFLTKVPFLRFVKEAVNQVINCSSQSKDKEQENTSSLNSMSAAGIISKPPLLEEIKIPCVTELVKTGVRFRPTNKGIESISFDVKTSTFFLPIINLDMNSPVVIKNLVAYEACSANGPLVLTRYTELMNGIIDTAEDAKYLREKGIIINRLKSDEEVTNLCNGMCKSIRLTKVPCIDKVIEDVNKFYNGRWNVKFRRYMKKYVFESWRLLTFIGAILMILLLAFQAFCSVYNCSRFMDVDSLN